MEQAVQRSHGPNTIAHTRLIRNVILNQLWCSLAALQRATSMLRCVYQVQELLLHHRQQLPVPRRQPRRRALQTTGLFGPGEMDLNTNSGVARTTVEMMQL